MLLLDNSAWSHLNSARVDSERRDTVTEWMQAGELATCLPFLLETGYSARSGAHHTAMLSSLSRLQNIQITPEIERKAQAAQGELAAIGHHRLSPADLIVAACAEAAAAGVLHYDRDYDLIAANTTLAFHSEWLAPAGSL